MTTIYKIDISTSPAPVLTNERAQVLDVLRGVAIFGILFNNIYGFSGYGFLTEEMRQQFSTFSIDHFLNALQIIFIEGKFYSIFSLLFGIGFSIILVRNKNRGINPLNIFYKRLLVLAVIGAAHLYFLWQGDILLLYALVGMLLPLFRNLSNRNLLLCATLFILSPIAIDLVRLALQWSPGHFLFPIGEAIDAKVGLTEENWRTYLFTDGSGWKEWWHWQQTSFIYRYATLLNSNRLFKVLGMFLLGYYVGRNMIYTNLHQYTHILKKIRNWGLLIGIPANVVVYIFEGDDKFIHASAWGMADTISYALGVVPLALAIASTIALSWMKSKNSWLKVFAPVGQMALTNYLAQTIICSMIFYGAGFGLGQKIGLAYVFLIAVAVFGLQIIYSNIWLRHFNYGPVEWIWRQLTYGKKIPLKKQKDFQLPVTKVKNAETVLNDAPTIL
jgi:uncharacterized protein